MWTLGYVEVERCFDGATCPNPIPPKASACLVYAGGSSADHEWDAAELELVKHLPRLPTWVPTPGSDDPLEAANEFLSWLAAHGVPAVEPRTGERTRLLWDLETGKEPDPAWYNRAADVTKAAGYANLGYGSISTLFGQPRRSGYFVANPTGVPHLYQRAGVRATQYVFNVATAGGKVDYSLVAAETVRQFWQPAA